MKITSATLASLLVGLLASALGALAFQAAGVNIVGYWKLDDTTGTTAVDTTGVNDLTYAGGPTPSTDIPAAMPAGSHSLSFDGVAAEASRTALTGLATGNTIHSLAAWIKVTALPANRAWILLLGNEGTGSHHWLINSAGATQFGVWGGAGQVQPTLTVGQWTHVAVTFDGTNLRGYVDGTLINTVAASFNLLGVPLTLGKSHLSENYFNGLLDDVRLYNRVLTQAEITSLAAGSFGPAAPIGLTATSGSGSVTLNWTSGPSGTLYNIKQSGTSGGSPPGTYTTVATDVATNSYTVTGLTPGVTYYFVVSAVTFGESPNSNEVPGTPLLVTALPNTGLFTSEVPTSTFFTIKFEGAVPSFTTVTLTVTSSNSGEGIVSDDGITFNGQITIPVVGPQVAGYSIPITVMGVNDFVIDPATAYTVTVTTVCLTNPAFDNLAIPAVNLINNDNDTAGITISKTVGLVTTESGGTDSFAVALNSKPSGVVTLTLVNSNTAEVLVSPLVINFDVSNWQGVAVNLTGLDDSVLDFAQPFTITGTLSAPSDPPYVGVLVPAVSGVNLDNEAIPPAKSAWGGNGGGCGLLGLELGLPFLLLRLRRRRQ